MRSLVNRWLSATVGIWSKPVPKTKRKNTIASADHDYLALCLQGGGAMGAYQVGVIEALQEKKKIRNTKQIKS